MIPLWKSPIKLPVELPVDPRWPDGRSFEGQWKSPIKLPVKLPVELPVKLTCRCPWSYPC